MISGLMVEVLVDPDYDVCAIETTEGGAVSAAARHRPDLMILDIALADGSGPAAVERIGRARPIPHLFVGGTVSQATVPGARLPSKPFLQADLVQAIGHALGATGANGTVRPLAA